MGLSLVAVGQGLVINPEWVELSRSGNERLIENEIRTTTIPKIALPAKLWGVIEAATGWFNINDDHEAQRQKATA
jgi:2,4-dienoyl-CoA reductase-like NADH-dependent reductase (Old Yellow Enzyme family)